MEQVRCWGLIHFKPARVSQQPAYDGPIATSAFSRLRQYASIPGQCYAELAVSSLAVA